MLCAGMLQRCNRLKYLCMLYDICQENSLCVRPFVTERMQAIGRKDLLSGRLNGMVGLSAVLVGFKEADESITSLSWLRVGAKQRERAAEKPGEQIAADERKHAGQGVSRNSTLYLGITGTTIPTLRRRQSMPVPVIRLQYRPTQSPMNENVSDGSPDQARPSRNNLFMRFPAGHPVLQTPAFL